MTTRDDHDDRLDRLREAGATRREQYLGRRLDDQQCSTCRFWVPSSLPHRRICEVWCIEQKARGWCQRFERWVETGSVLGRSAGR